MQRFASTLDRTGIWLSLICGLHCLLIPVVVFALPATEHLFGQVTLGFGDSGHDRTHGLILAIALPVALVSLLRSFLKFGQFTPLFLGGLGLGILALGVTASAEIHRYDLWLSLTGSGLLLIAHWQNLRTCQGRHA